MQIISGATFQNCAFLIWCDNHMQTKFRLKAELLRPSTPKALSQTKTSHAPTSWRQRKDRPICNLSINQLHRYLVIVAFPLVAAENLLPERKPLTSW